MLNQFNESIKLKGEAGAMLLEIEGRIGKGEIKQQLKPVLSFQRSRPEGYLQGSIHQALTTILRLHGKSGV